MTCDQLGGVELYVDLESPRFEGVEIDKYNFIRVMEPSHYGEVALDDFGSGFEIREDGVYLKLPDDRLWASLTEAERTVLAEHPRGRPDKPVLAFPFTLKELKACLDWAARVGHDLPISENALLKVIDAQKSQEPTALTDSESAQQKTVDVRPVLIPQQRVDVIQRWFNSQSDYTRDTLRPPKRNSGKPWACQDCWDWLSDQGYTSAGGLFGNAKQRGSAKTKAFSAAWSAFINKG